MMSKDINQTQEPSHFELLNQAATAFLRAIAPSYGVVKTQVSADKAPKVTP